ncbi:MAG: hypothetical protein HY774_20120 [Acidobacteria bacterium]|nr:hypothetical protein [Acidobacteriota bacterium]
MTPNEFSNFQDDRLDQDSPWKELLELYFDEFIDWIMFYHPNLNKDWVKK